MSLQGSLDTFALSDVVMLLATTKKTGELRIHGSRAEDGTADDTESTLEFVSGRLACGPDPSVPLAEAVFGLLRLRKGWFAFSPDPTRAARPDEELFEVEPVLADAAAQFEEWTEIVRVVPSPFAWVRLASPAPRPELNVSAAEWAVIVAVGSGRSVDGTVRELGSGELAGFRAIKELVEAGLATVEARPVTIGAGTLTTDEGLMPTGDPAVETAAMTETLQWATPVSTWGTTLPDLVDGSGVDDWRTGPETSAVFDGADGPNYGVLRVVPDPEPASDWRAQVAGIHDLDSFGDGAAGDGHPLRTPDAEIPSLDETPMVVELGEPEADGAEPLNRGLLLKFLSSVRD